MKAIRIHEYGNADALRHEDAPIPEPGPGDLRIRVHAAAVNPVDWKIREGYLSAVLPHEMPLTLGWDVSGVVDALGADVAGFSLGDAVYSRPDITRQGAYAEYIVVRASEVATKPESLSHVEAAAAPLAALTAWQGLFDHAKLVKGRACADSCGRRRRGEFRCAVCKVGWRTCHLHGVRGKRSARA